MNQKTDDPRDPTESPESQPPDDQEEQEREEFAADVEAEEHDEVAENREAVAASEAPADRETAPGDAGPTPAATARAPAATPAPAGRGPAALAWIAFLLAVLALAGVAYLGWQGQDRGTESAANAQVIDTLSGRLDRASAGIGELDSRLDALGEEAAALAKELQALESRLRNRMDELAEQNDSIAPRLANLEDALSSLQGISAGAREHWMLAEAEHYLQIANARLQLAGDPDAALLALNLADERIRQLADPALAGVRRALAREAQSLAAHERTDIEGVTLALANLADRVESLPLNEQVAEPSAEADAPAPEGSGFSRALAAVQRAFGDLVSVRRTDEATRPLLSPEAAYFLRANLALQFQSARLAFLRNEPTAFRRSLDDAAAWLERYYDAGSRAVQQALATLDELRDSVVESRPPDISGSLRLLRQYRSQRGRETPAGADDEPAQ